MRRLVSGLFLALTLFVVATFTPTPASAESCVSRWEDCRDDAQDAFDRGEVGVVRYSLLLDGCDVGYGFCSIAKY